MSGATGTGGTEGASRPTAPGAGIDVDVEPDPSTTVPETTATAEQRQEQLQEHRQESVKKRSHRLKY